MNNDSNLGLQQFLPNDLINEIREQFAEAIRMAEKHFNSHSADEDSVTGALGQELSRIGPISKEVDGQQFKILFGYEKLRGRGPGAPEKEYGADGLFEISILGLNGEVLFNKASVEIVEVLA